jgi:hypothetical protein
MKRLLSLALALALGIVLGVFAVRTRPDTQKLEWTPEKVVSSYARSTKRRLGVLHSGGGGSAGERQDRDLHRVSRENAGARSPLCALA